MGHDIVQVPEFNRKQLSAFFREKIIMYPSDQMASHSYRTKSSLRLSITCYSLRAAVIPNMNSTSAST